MEIRPKQVLVWRNSRYEVKTLPFSFGGRVGKTNTNIKEANELYDRLASEAEVIKENAK